MKKSSLLLLTWYKRIRYIKYVEVQKQWQIKTQNDHQTQSCLKTNGRLEKLSRNGFPLPLSKRLLRSRNALIRTLLLPVKFWPLPKHWQKRQQIKALVLCSAAEGQPLPFLKSLRSNLTMNHFSIFVNGTSVLLHAHGGV